MSAKLDDVTGLSVDISIVSPKLELCAKSTPNPSTKCLLVQVLNLRLYDKSRCP